MTLKFASILVLAATLGTPVLAASTSSTAAAVKSAEAYARVSPDDGGTQIELAAAYQRAGRTADANTTFRRALTLENAMLETPTGDSVWSHQVARQALARDAALAAR